jgi:NitT/TauT family transport system permease protein/putative hydroxymethylpyrimidine transport system permease protein
MKRWGLPALVLAALLAIWQALAASGALADLLGLEPFLVPSPAEIAEALWDERALLAENAWVTLQEVALGFLCAVLAGIAFALLLHLSETARIAFQPLIVASQTIPIPAIAPILIILFGFGIGPKLAVVALIAFFPLAINALAGLSSVDPEATKMMRSLDASRAQLLWRLELPAALPYVFTGAKIAVAISVIGAVFGEWVGSDSGLGHQILIDNANLNTARMFAAVAVLSAISLGLYGLLALAERRLVTWR